VYKVIRKKAEQIMMHF